MLFIQKNLWYNVDMKIVNLGSGSKGNCTLVAGNNFCIMIDAGLPIKEIEEKLDSLNVSPTQIRGILITHEHSDHIKSVGKLSKKYHIPVYAHISEWPVLETKIADVPFNLRNGFENSFYIENMQISTFKLSHDANLCLGYTINIDGEKFSIATDLGYCPNSVVEKLKGSQVVLIEANHDENILSNNPHYPLILKKRILSNKGHLSNTQSANVILQLVGGTNQIILGHLSEENNTPELAYNTICSILSKNGIEEGKHIFIDIANQHKMSNIYEIKKKN